MYSTIEKSFYFHPINAINCSNTVIIRIFRAGTFQQFWPPSLFSCRFLRAPLLRLWGTFHLPLFRKRMCVNVSFTIFSHDHLVLIIFAKFNYEWIALYYLCAKNIHTIYCWVYIENYRLPHTSPNQNVWGALVVMRLKTKRLDSRSGQ